MTHIVHQGAYQIDDMPVPDGYTSIRAHEDSVAKAREVKEELGLTWNQYFEQAAEELQS